MLVLFLVIFSNLPIKLKFIIRNTYIIYHAPHAPHATHRTPRNKWMTLTHAIMKIVDSQDYPNVNHQNILIRRITSYKNRLNNILLLKYQEDIFRKYKWYSYINKKKSESTLIRNIKLKYGKDSILIMGDYSDKNCANKLKGKMSTPNLGLKRKLGEYFTVYTLDEFRTSCLNYKTEEKCENLYLPDKKGIVRSIHSILTYQTENNRMGCINRDENATNNMIKLVNYFIENKDRPEKFRRDFKFETEIKDDNPSLYKNKLASNIIKPAKVQLYRQKRNMK